MEAKRIRLLLLMTLAVSIALSVGTVFGYAYTSPDLDQVIPQVIVNCDSTSEGCHGGIFFIFSTIQIQISLLNCLPHRSHAERLSIHERARCS